MSSLGVGIVGLPNCGKTTLFNALSRSGALTASYPYATIEPNVRVVSVSDVRLTEFARLTESARIVPATVRYVDIAGLAQDVYKKLEALSVLQANHERHGNGFPWLQNTVREAFLVGYGQYGSPATGTSYCILNQGAIG